MRFGLNRRLFLENDPGLQRFCLRTTEIQGFIAAFTGDTHEERNFLTEKSKNVQSKKSFLTEKSKFIHEEKSVFAEKSKIVHEKRDFLRSKMVNFQHFYGKNGRGRESYAEPNTF